MEVKSNIEYHSLHSFERKFVYKGYEVKVYTRPLLNQAHKTLNNQIELDFYARMDN